MVSRGRSAKASYADIARSSVLSGANLVPLGGQVRSGCMKPRSSVFNRISFPGMIDGMGDVYLKSSRSSGLLPLSKRLTSIERG